MTDAAPEPRDRGWLVVFAIALTVFVASASPVVYWGDSAELSRRAISVELLPTARGYPLHRVLCWAAGRLTGDPALGANLVSAFFGAVSVALVFEIARRLTRSRTAAATAAAISGLAHTFWQYCAVAEVYTLHTAILLGALLLCVATDSGRRAPRWGLGVLLGISLLHHRMIVFAVPGILYWLWTGTPRGSRLAVFLDVAGGAVLGAIPFAVLCAVASRSPPASAANPVWWWFEDVFMGGERNSDFLLGEGRKGLAVSAGYLGKWLVLNLPGPALLLAAAGFARARARVAVFLGVEALAHLWFPLRYDWTGDQYTFLIPLYPVLALAAAVGVAWIEETRGVRTARIAFACAAAAPVVVYAGIAFTSLAQRLLPGLRPEAARATLWPPRTGDFGPQDWCIRNLEAMPRNARLNADWGDGQVYLYLQEARGFRRDVTVSVWNRNERKSPVFLGDGTPEWLTVPPFTKGLPPIVESVRERLEPHGDGVFRVVPR